MMRSAARGGRAATRQFTRRIGHLRIVAVNDVYELDNLPRLATLVRVCGAGLPKVSGLHRPHAPPCERPPHAPPC